MKDRVSSKGDILVNDISYYKEISDCAPYGTKCILINKEAGVAYIGVLHRSDTFATHYAALPTFKE